MKTNLNTLIAIGSIAAVLLVPKPFAATQDSTLVPFEIKDQFDRVYTEKDFQDTIVVMIGSDQGGSKYNPVWNKAIRDSLKNEPGFERIRFAGVADLRVVPFYMKAFVKRRFPQEQKNWFLVDWDGHFAKTYQFEPGACNILIFDRDGSLVYRTHCQDMDQPKLDTILKKLKTLIATSPEEADDGNP